LSNNSSKKSGVYLDETIVRIRANATGKMKLINRTSTAQRFRIGRLPPPFYTAFAEVTVKPNFYLNIPVRYAPEAAASGRRCHEFRARLENSDLGLELVCTLIGD
jgi:hypothetical protein